MFSQYTYYIHKAMQIPPQSKFCPPHKENPYSLVGSLPSPSPSFLSPISAPDNH